MFFVQKFRATFHHLEEMEKHNPCEILICPFLPEAVNTHCLFLLKSSWTQFWFQVNIKFIK